MTRRITIGIAGASGVTYGVRLLKLLKDTAYETHLIISEAGKLNIEIETEYSASHHHHHRGMAPAWGWRWASVSGQG